MVFYNTNAAKEALRNTISPTIRAGYVFVFAVIVALISWGVLFPVERFSVTSATIIPDNKTVEVTSKEGGIVSEVAVKEGQYVTAGQKLIDLEHALTKEEIDKIDSHIIALKVAEVRLVSEKDNLESVEITEELIKFNGHPDLSKFLDMEMNLFNANLAKYKARFVDIDKNIREYESVIIEEEIHRASFEEQVRNAEKKISILSKPQNKKTNKTKLAAIVKKQKELQDKLEKTVKNISANKKSITAEKQKKLDVILARSEKAITDLEKVQTKVSELNAELAELKKGELSSTIVSPVNGIVKNLNSLRRNDIILSGKNVMEISPDNNFEVFEARIPYKNIPSLRSNQDLIIKASTFDNKLEKIVGKIEKLLPHGDTQNNGNKEEFISVQIRVNSNHTRGLREMMQNGSEVPVQFILLEEPAPLLENISRPVIDKLRGVLAES